MYIHNIDLHYHAGQERHQQTGLRDYLEHARMTARLILGLTDHLNLFLEPKPDSNKRFPYSQDLNGFIRFRSEIEESKGEFPSMRLLFGPEVSSRTDLNQIPDTVVEMSDFFICEPPYSGRTVAERTDAFVQRMSQIAEFTGSTGKKAFVAHPLRSPVNRRLVKSDIEPWVTELAPRPDGAYSPQELSEFFGLDIQALGEASKEYGIPLEINGSTHFRVRASNIPAMLQMLWAVNDLLYASGATFVPGSDQHGFIAGNNNRLGRCVPFETFDRMGLTAKDITFLHGLIE